MRRPLGTHPIYWRSFQAKPPSHWTVKSIAELSESFKGKQPDRVFENPTSTSKPYLLIEGLVGGEPLFTEDSPVPYITKRDIVVVADGSRSSLALRGVDGALGSTLLCYRAKKDCDQDFLFYLLQSLYPYTNTATIGGALPHLDKRLLHTLRLAVPDEKEMKSIGELLISVDHNIDAANRKLAAARKLKTALMQQLFTRGLPGRHSHFQQTEIGQVPAEWDLLPLGKIASVVSGIALNAEREPKVNPRQYLTVIHVQRERLDLTDIRYLELFPDEIPDALLETGDILVLKDTRMPRRSAAPHWPPPM